MDRAASCLPARSEPMSGCVYGENGGCGLGREVSCLGPCPGAHQPPLTNRTAPADRHTHTANHLHGPGLLVRCWRRTHSPKLLTCRWRRRCAPRNPPPPHPPPPSGKADPPSYPTGLLAMQNASCVRTAGISGLARGSQVTSEARMPCHVCGPIPRSASVVAHQQG